MKILIITREYPPYMLGGVGIYVYNLIKQLKEQYADDVRIDIFTVEAETDIGQKFSPLPVDGIHRCNVTGIPLFNLLHFIVLANRFVKKYGVHYDIIHDQCDCIQHQHVPVVHTAHTTYMQERLYYDRVNESIVQGLAVQTWLAVLYNIEKQSLQRSSAIIAPTNEVKQHILHYFKIKCDPVVIHHGVDSTVFKPDAIGDKKYDCIFVGRFAPRKGLPYLFDALAAIRDRQLNVLLCGEVHLRLFNFVQRQIDQQHHNYIVRGDISHYDMVKMYNQSKIMVLPSLYESFGLVLLESLSCEVPVISSDIGGIPEVVDHDDDGILIPPKNVQALTDAIMLLLDNSTMRETMGLKGRQTALEKFSWETTAQKTYKVYQRVKSA